MENDPNNKKDSKGKRLFKKAIRRNSKSNNGSQQSGMEQGISVSRSKSFENKSGSEGGADKPSPSVPPNDEAKPRKSVDIQEGRNQVFEEADADSKKDVKLRSPRNDRFLEPENSRRGLKRKLEEEGGAGTSGTSTGASDTDPDDKDPSKDKKKKNRCAVCRKKVGLTGFECRCGGLFCAVHRYSDKHDCSFDYRELGAQEIRRNNPVVVSQKIHKI